MPDHGLESFGQGCDPARIDLRNEHNHIAVLGGIPAVPADNPKHFCRARLGQIDCFYDVSTDLALGVTAADRIDKQRILLAELTRIKPSCKDGFPSLIVGPGGELRDVIDGAIGFYSAQLAKIVHSMAAIGRAATNTNQEKASLALSQPIKLGCQSLNGSK